MVVITQVFIFLYFETLVRTSVDDVRTESFLTPLICPSRVYCSIKFVHIKHDYKILCCTIKLYTTSKKSKDMFLSEEIKNKCYKQESVIKLKDDTKKKRSNTILLLKR